jgi:phosphoribosylglycinamide formyltransferase-1
LAILISGRGSNMKAILEAVKSNKLKGITKVIVISNNPEAPGLNIARDDYGVQTVTILNKNKQDFENELLSILSINNFGVTDTLICLAGFMRIIGPTIVNKFQYRIINIHPSLLPSFRGLNAQRQALDAGVKIAGCTVHFVDTGIDTGPIILQKCVPVFSYDTEQSLSDRILVSEHEAYVTAIELISSNRIKVKDNKVVEG